MDTTRSRKINQLILISVLSALFIYILLRAWHVSFTHDECMSLKILTGEDKGIAKAANNHRLNTLLMHFFYFLFGDREFYLRLPAILGFCLYAFFSYKILIKAGNLALVLIGIPLLLFNPYQLDFFALARGYGLALGFGLASIYFLLDSETCTTYKRLTLNMLLAFAASLLSTYANYFSINLNVCMMICFFLEVIRMSGDKSIRFNFKDKINIGLVYLFNLIFLFILYLQIMVLRNDNELSFGGQNNFIQDVLTLLIHRSLYFNYMGELFWQILRQVILVIFGFSLFYQLFSSRYNSLSRIVILTFLMVFATIVQFYTLGTFYPPVRSSQLYITLFGLLLFFLIREANEFLQHKNLRVIFGSLLVVVLTVPLSWHLITSMNLTYSNEWRTDVHTREVMNKIAEEYSKKKSNGAKVSISSNWFLEPSINYYRHRNSMDYLIPATRKGIQLNTDFVYCLINDKESMNLSKYYRTVSVYPDIHAVLLMK